MYGPDQQSTENPSTLAALDGVRVLDVSTLFAGPLAATFLGDFGADVVKVEHPRRPDAARGHGPQKNGASLWWKTLGRNKRDVTIDLSNPEGAEVLLRLVADADVMIENFRPGTLERWGLSPDRLFAANPRLILARVTAFGQFGPYSSRPGFGSLAEAMSGFAALTGEPDGPPTLPPFGLADGIAALATAYAIMVALRGAQRDGRGQVVDMAIIEPILMMLGGQITAWDQLGIVQPRVGNRSVNNAPRNVYRSQDGVWLAVSTSSQSIAERVMRLVGRGDVVDEEWFATGHDRAQHADELDAAVQGWIGQRDAAEVVAAFEEANAAISPVYDVRGVVDDPQYRALETVVRVEDEDLGLVAMQNVLFRMSRTPGSIRWPGRRHGQDTEAVLGELGYSDAELAALREAGAI
ncbi:CoA transferase [Microbacterium sp. KR10-403]|uniref:CaiB/BaiF CoA transferase family protein n=1 Tax=Microbacterium sp. KR10-403 TaxID=3158581 RepID=UPI0032E373F1